jgi:hypothetical protein
MAATYDHHSYGEERRIEPVDIAMAAFLGYAQRGPTWPQLVNSWHDFVHWYGSHDSSAHLAYVVEGYFRNGGRRCYIARIAGSGAQCAGLEFPPLRVQAIGPGTWGNRIAVRIRPTGRNRFRLTVRYWDDDPPPDFNVPRPHILPDLEETFDHLTVDPASPDYILTRLAKGQSHLVYVEWLEGQKRALPRPRDFALLRGGADGLMPTTADFLGRVHNAPYLCQGLNCLRDGPDVGLVCVAEDVWDETVHFALIGHCSDPTLGRMAIMTVPCDLESPAQIHPPTSPFAALYYPWLEVLDPLTYKPRLIPPVGHIAAIYARVDQQYGIHRAPANEPISGILGVQKTLSPEDYQLLTTRRVNVIRDLTASRRGVVVWSAFTLANNARWRYVQVRRLANLVLRSTILHTRWVVEQPNSPSLWDEVRIAVGDFLHRLWKQGYLQGRKPEEAFYVRCDRSTMTSMDITAGRVVILIGIAPLRPGEFYHFQVTQSPQGARVTEH